MKNKITDVRNLLIEGMDRLLNPDEGDTFDVERAKALAGLAKVAVESAKAEVAFLKVAHGMGADVDDTGFFTPAAKGLGDGKSRAGV
jgi:hypothetical protein